MDFAFLIHSRDYTDVQRKFPIAKYLPKNWVEFWCLHWPPVVVSKIDGLKDKEGKDIKGWLIGVPMTAKQMIEKRELAKKRIIQAINKAEKLGAKIVGLGALTSSVTNGGEKIRDKVSIQLTTGNTLTAGTTFTHAKELIDKNSIKKIGIVGATGSIGQAVTKLLIKLYPQIEFLLFAKTEDHLKHLEEDLIRLVPNANVSCFINNFDKLREAEFIIVTTSSADAFIKSKYLKQGAILYDVTQPQNISVSEMRSRPDLKIFDGGLIMVDALQKKLPLGLPEKTVFSCLGETMLLSLENNRTENFLGKVNPDKVASMIAIANKYNFKPTQLNK